jgi:hypothetical protein
VIEYASGVARRDVDEVLSGLAKTGTILETDRAALRDTVTTILGREDLTFLDQSDWVATVCYAEGSGSARDLVSFVRARILLETQLEDVNRRLDQVDPNLRYPRFEARFAYTSVAKPYVVWPCIKGLFGFGGKGDGVITCAEARAMQAASNCDMDRMPGPVYPPREDVPRTRIGLRLGSTGSTAKGDVSDPGYRRAWQVGAFGRFSVGRRWKTRADLWWATDQSSPVGGI